jgi:peroxiredoxin
MEGREILTKIHLDAGKDRGDHGPAELQRVPRHNHTLGADCEEIVASTGLDGWMLFRPSGHYWCVHMKRLIMISMLFLNLLAGNSLAEQAVSPAPAFALKDLHGSRVSLDQYRGKVLFIAFWAPWCFSCREEFPELDRLQRKYQNDGFEVLGLCEDTTELAASLFLKNVPVSFTIAVDPRRSVAEAYRLTNLPSGYLIDRAGMIRFRYRGFDKTAVRTYEEDIRSLLQK